MKRKYYIVIVRPLLLLTYQAFISILCPPSPEIHHLLESLQRLSPHLRDRKEDLDFLQTLLKSNEFHSLIQVCQTMDIYIYAIFLYLK